MCCKSRHSWAMLILRIMVGSVFIMHGAQKMLKLFNPEKIGTFTQYISSLGMPAFLGYLVGPFEFFGGIMILFGIATEIGALLIVPVMLGAIFLVHFNGGYFAPKGFEYPLNLLLACLALIAGGPGYWTFWNPFKKECRNKNN